MVHTPFAAKADRKGRISRLIFGFGALVALAILFAGIVGNTLRAAEQRRQSEAWQVHTLQVLVTTESLMGAANMAIRGERGYLITGEDRFLRPFEQGRRSAPVLLERLANQTRDNPVQQRHVGELGARLTHYFAVLEKAIALRRDGQEQAAVALVRSGAGMREIDRLLAVLGAVEAEEQRLLGQRTAASDVVNAQADWNNYALAGVGVIFFLIAGMAASATVRAQNRARRMADQLRRSASTDELTGLANRRAFLQALEVEVNAARVTGKPLSVAVADVDFFKRVNDRHGHGGGDEVLQALSRIAEQTMRAGDIVGRLGGEEFAILMPDTDEMAARIACERLRGAISGRKIRLQSGEEIGITLSTGIALLVPGDDRDKLVRRADSALYQAKEGGRNQVRLAA